MRKSEQLRRLAGNPSGQTMQTAAGTQQTGAMDDRAGGRRRGRPQGATTEHGVPNPAAWGTPSSGRHGEQRKAAARAKSGSPLPITPGPTANRLKASRAPRPSELAKKLVAMGEGCTTTTSMPRLRISAANEVANMVIHLQQRQRCPEA